VAASLQCLAFYYGKAPAFADQDSRRLDAARSVADAQRIARINQQGRVASLPHLGHPGGAKFTAGSAATGMYRGSRLWEAAVKEATSLKQDDVIKALDHAKISQGPGGPAEMVPRQHHLRMNMYIAQAKSGRFEIVKNLGVMDPKECMQGMM
jgi:Periplasmic binding protein